MLCFGFHAQIELRAFCAKHSGNLDLDDSVALESHEQNHTVGSDSLGSSIESALLPGNKIKKLKIGCKNGDKVTFQMRISDAKSNDLGVRERQDTGIKDADSNTKLKSGSGVEEYEDVSTQLSDIGLGGTGDDVKTSRVLDLGLVLKKVLVISFIFLACWWILSNRICLFQLIHRGKVSLKQIAAEIGIQEASLASRLAVIFGLFFFDIFCMHQMDFEISLTCPLCVKLLLQDNHLSPDLYCKLLKWLKGRSYLDTAEKDWRAKLSCLVPSKAELKTDDNTDAVAVRDLDISDVPVKSVPPRRRTVGNIRILKEDNAVSLCIDKSLGNGLITKEGTDPEDTIAEHDNLNKDSNLDGMEEVTVL